MTTSDAPDDSELMVVLTQSFDSRAEAEAACRAHVPPGRFMQYEPRHGRDGQWHITFNLRPDWREISKSPRVDQPVREGERFVMRDEASVRVMTHWFAPFTGGHSALVPQGTVLVAKDAQLATNPGFSLVPEDYERLEALLVPKSDRLADKYGGYSLHFDLDDIGMILEEVT